MVSRRATFRTAVLLLMLVGVGASAQTLMFPGDIVFLGYQHDDPDAFAFMLLTDVSAGTQVKFTDNGWNGNTGEFNTTEGTTVWTAGADYSRGTILRYDDPASGEFAGSLQGLSTVGDQVIAYQGEETRPFFIAGYGSNDRWVTSGEDPTSSYSFVPPTLELGLTVRGFQSEIDNGYYDPIDHIDNGAIDTGTPLDFLLAVNDSSLTWARTSTGTGFVFPDWDLTLVTAPTIVVDGDGHLIDYGAVVFNTTSAPQALSVAGYGLDDDLTVTAPSGFEVSLQSTTGFSGVVTLSPTGGVLAATDVYVRFAPTAVQAYSDTLFVTGGGAAARDVILGGEGALALGLAQAAPSNATGALAGSDIFLRAEAGQSLRLDMTGVADGTIGKVRVTLPADWSGLDAGNVSFGGDAFAGASAAVAGSVLEVTGAGLTDAVTGAVTITGLTAPDPTAQDDDGVRVLTVEVATASGAYLQLVEQPVVYVTIPIVNLRDYSAAYLPLDEGDTVAIAGTATVEDGVFSVTSLQVYLQDATGGMYVNYIGDTFPVARGYDYVAKGVVGDFGGNFRIVPEGVLADNIFELGGGTLPAPNTLTVAQILADPESIEGTLIRVNDLEILSGTWGADTTLVTSDDAGVSNINLRIDGDTDLVGMTPPTGAFSVTGILYQYDSTAPHDSGYRILPRSQADFSGVSAVDDPSPGLPARFALLPSYPNPFNARTELRFSLPRTAAVDLAVYDLEGRRVRTFASGEAWSAGAHALPFDGLDDAGRGMASGVYFVRFAGGGVVQVDKLVLVK